jgi:hypothetical protein
VGDRGSGWVVDVIPGLTTNDSQASVNVEWTRRVGNRKGGRHTHEQVESYLRRRPGPRVVIWKS